VASAVGSIGADGITIVAADGSVLGGRGAPRLGINWVDDANVTGLRLVDGRAPAGPAEVAIDAVSAQKAGYGVGGTVRLVGPAGPFAAELAGVFRYGTSGNLAGATIVAFDTARAQQVLLGGADAFTQVDVVAADGVSQDSLAASIGADLGGAATVRTGTQAADDATSAIVEGLAFVNVFLLVFAGIALFVGTFIILNTFAMLVAQRTRELALLRALGATRGQVVRSIVVEAGLVGLAGSLTGIAVGVVVAYGLRALFGALGADLASDGLVLAPRTIAAGLVVGVATTVVAALAPAVRAARISPMAALRDDVVAPPAASRVRGTVGALIAGAGAVAMVVGASRGTDGTVLVGLGAVALLVGAIVASPALARPVVSGVGFALPRLFGTVGALAVSNARRQPRRTAATASALMIGLALVSALTVFATSAKASITEVIDRVIGAQFVVSNSAPRTPIAADVVAQVAAIPGVAVVSPVAVVPARIGAEVGPVTVIDPATFGQVVTLPTVAGSLSDLGADAIAVDESTATDAGLRLGDPVRVEFTSGARDLRLAAVYAGAGEFTGYVLPRAALVAVGVQPADRLVYVKADAGADLDRMQRDLQHAVAADPTVDVQSQAQFAQEITSNVDQVLLILVLLLSLAVLIAVLGIVNTLVLSVAERTREIGLLRAVGAGRRQIRVMIVLEALVIALFGALVGLALGLGFAIGLQRTLVDQGITVLAIPWSGLLAFLVLAAIVGVLAALWPARRASRLDILAAIAAE